MTSQALACVLAAGFGLSSPGPGETNVPLQPILERLDKVAGLYRDNALSFACHEHILYTSGKPDPVVYDLEYIYEFDEKKTLHDHRTWPGGRKDHPGRDVAMSELSVPSYVMRAYSSIFVFQREKRPSYQFSVLGNETVLGRDAWVIGFESIPPYREAYNDWFGQAWVDRETYQLLRVKQMKADQHEEKLRLEADLDASGGRRPTEHVIEEIEIEFSVEKNQMRFPSRVVTRRSRYQIRETSKGRKSVEWPLFKVEQTYSSYQFYGVRTSEQIRDLVNPEAAPKNHP